MKENYSRAVLLSSILVGIFAGIYLLFISPFELGIDFRAYYYAAEAFLAGGDMYTATPPGYPNYHYIYLPLVILYFTPFAFLGEWQLAFAVQTLISMIAVSVLGWFTVRFITRYRSLATVDVVLIYVYLFLASVSVHTFLQGQVNLLLGTLVSVGFLQWIQRDLTPSGVLLGVAALLKIFPAAFGLIYLPYRDLRAIGAAVTTGIGTLVLSVLLFGITLHQRFIEILLGRFDSSNLTGGLDPTSALMTVRRPISVLFPDMTPSLMVLLGGIVLLLPIIYLWYRVRTVDANTRNRRLVAALGTLICILLFFPSFFMYYSLLFGPLLAAVYLIADPFPRAAILAGTAISNLGFTLEQVRAVLAVLPLPEMVSDSFLAVLTPVLTFATPPFYGLLLVLGGCLLYVSPYRKNHERNKPNCGEKKTLQTD